MAINCPSSLPSVTLVILRTIRIGLAAVSVPCQVPATSCADTLAPDQTSTASSAKTRNLIGGEYDINAAIVRSLPSRLDPQQRAVALVGDHVEQPVRALPDVADAPAFVLEQRLAAGLFHRAVEHDALDAPRTRNLAVAHTTDEEIALPLGESLARIEGHARRRDRRHEVDDRRGHALGLKAAGLIRPGVGAAETDERPAVVAAGLDDVDFVAAVRAHLGFPDRLRRLVPDETLGRAMAERVDLGPIAFLADERVVLRDRAVGVVAEDLAAQAHLVLRHLPGLAPGAHEERPVRQEQQTRHRAGALHPDDVLDLRQRRA